MCAPSLSTRTTRCRSTATFSFGAMPQIQCALHPYPQGRRGAGRLQPSPSELRHKYNVRSIPIRKDGEVQVNCNACSIPTYKDDEVQVDWSLHLRVASQ